MKLRAIYLQMETIVCSEHCSGDKLKSVLFLPKQQQQQQQTRNVRLKCIFGAERMHVWCNHKIEC